MNTRSSLSRAQAALRTQAFPMIGFLVLQYILGMLTNLFETFPDTTLPGQFWAFARSQVLIVAHMVVGALLVIGAIMFVIRAARLHDRRWVLSSVVGLIGIVLAFFGGIQFVTSQVDGYSLTMALAAILALLAYGWGLISAPRQG